MGLHMVEDDVFFGGIKIIEIAAGIHVSDLRMLLDVMVMPKLMVAPVIKIIVMEHRPTKQRLDIEIPREFLGELVGLFRHPNHMIVGPHLMMVDEALHPKNIRIMLEFFEIGVVFFFLFSGEFHLTLKYTSFW